MTAAHGSWREVGSAARSFALPAVALRLLLRERRLWPLAALPLLLSVAAGVGAAATVLAWSGEIRDFASGLLPVLTAEAWYAWLWVGPLRALAFVLGLAFIAALAALAVVAAFALASLVASPFHDALARRVEEIVTGRVEVLDEHGLAGVLRQAFRALREEARRLGFLLALWLTLGAASLLVPGGQLLAGPALLLASALLLPLDYAGYTFDRRGVPFAERRRWLRRHLGPALGFGAAALLLCAVPGLNLFALPVLVVAGTLLALRHPVRAGVPAAGTATSP